MNHTQLALLDELLANEDLKRHGDWLIGNAQDEEVVSAVMELAAADQTDFQTQAGAIGIRFSDAIRAYIG